MNKKKEVVADPNLTEDMPVNVDSLWIIGPRAKGGKRENNYHGNESHTPEGHKSVSSRGETNACRRRGAFNLNLEDEPAYSSDNRVWELIIRVEFRERLGGNFLRGEFDHPAMAREL